MKRWQGSCIGAVLVLLIGGASLFFIVPVGGAMLIGMPPVFDKLTSMVVCPGAVAVSQDEYNSGPVTLSRQLVQAQRDDGRGRRRARAALRYPLHG